MFSAADLIAAAEARFGAAALRLRVNGANDAEKDLELAKVAGSVISRVQAAAQVAGSWPLTGTWPAGSVDPADGTTDISGTPYSDIWPPDLLQRALDLFDWRTYSTLEVVPDSKVTLGKQAEQYFLNVARGVDSLGIGAPADRAPSVPLSTRARDGSTLMGDGSADRRNVLDEFRGPGWDLFRR
jgi:hypothetical protein